MSVSVCGICGGPLRLLHEGASVPVSPAQMAPTNHSPRVYGDLYLCSRCGTVSQPSLPGGDELHGLYREMSDEAYLDEEVGRRRTANRLLGLIEGQVRPGRLLDAGCGHGMLLDEARRRGWDTVGLDLSPAAVSHSRDRLGLDVRETPVEQFSDDGQFDAIVMADVIEHVGDPRAVLAHCFGLLAPGGVLLVATPDPSSRVAALAGAGWWGYLRAHAYLLPARTLERLLRDSGFDIAERRSLVRTFSAAYWFSGARDRGGPLGKLAGAVGRAVPDRLSLSLTLLDEYVVVARRPSVAGELRPQPTTSSAS